MKIEKDRLLNYIRDNVDDAYKKREPARECMEKFNGDTATEEERWEVLNAMENFWYMSGRRDALLDIWSLVDEKTFS